MCMYERGREAGISVISVQEIPILISSKLIRPPDIVCRRTYILPVFLLSSFFRRLISEVATAYIFGMKHDIDNRSSALTTTRCLLHRVKMS